MFGIDSFAIQRTENKYTIYNLQVTSNNWNYWHMIRIPNWIEKWHWYKCRTRLHFLLSWFKRFRLMVEWMFNKTFGKSLMASSCARHSVQCSLKWILFRKKSTKRQNKTIHYLNSRLHKLQVRAGICYAFGQQHFDKNAVWWTSVELSVSGRSIFSLLLLKIISYFISRDKVFNFMFLIFWRL